MTQDKIVGWHWPFRGKDVVFCHACKPSPPDDEKCTPIYAGDYDGDLCESCEEPLMAAVQETSA